MPIKKVRTSPRAGATFKKLYKGRSYTLEVVVSRDNELRYKVGRELYGSPSGAAKAITEREINGWKFWGMDQ